MPRTPTIRIVEFLGQYTREVVTPTKNPLVGDTITIVTYWENPGKDEGVIYVGLYEQKIDGTWQPSISTLLYGPVELYMAPGSSSVRAEFEYQTWQEGQPLLVLVVDDDFGNDNYRNAEISGIEVSPISNSADTDGGMLFLVAALGLLISIMGVAFYFMRRSAGEEDYYDEDYDDEDYDDQEYDDEDYEEEYY